MYMISIVPRSLSDEARLPVKGIYAPPDTTSEVL
jgi:hypothetical protein